MSRGNQSKGGDERVLVLHWMESGDVDDVAAVRLESDILSGRCAIALAPIALQLDPVLDHRDRPGAESIGTTQGLRTELAHRVHVVGNASEQQTVPEAARAPDDVRIVPAVFGENQARPRPGQKLGQRGVEEWRVLMRVDHLD